MQFGRSSGGSRRWDGGGGMVRGESMVGRRSRAENVTLNKRRSIKMCGTSTQEAATRQTVDNFTRVHSPSFTLAPFKGQWPLGMALS